MAFKHIAGLAVTAALMSTQVQAKTEIEWWHAMGGALGKKVNEIADNFNASQSEYEIKPVFKGTYAETMTGAIAAFRAKEQPAIVQVFEVGTATMMGAKKGKWKWVIPPSAADFELLTSYTFAGKGKKGEVHQKWWSDNLFKPFARHQKNNKIYRKK